MEQAMYWPNPANNVNDVLRKAVKAQTRCGSNRTGAIATIADWLGVSPQIIKMRINDEIVGQPRCKKLLADRCWEFLAVLAQKERAWVEHLALEVEQNRLRLQLDLPLEGTPNAKSRRKSAARRVARDESDIATARRALADFEKIKRQRS
jgi:hypothetical protein